MMDNAVMHTKESAQQNRSFNRLRKVKELFLFHDKLFRKGMALTLQMI